MKSYRVFALLATAAALGACGGFGVKAERAVPSPSRAKASADRAEVLEEAKVEAREAPAAPAAAGAETTTGDIQEASLVSPPAPEKRVRIYSGFCRLTVNEPEETKKELERIAVESGGYVESMAGPNVVLRVPAARFREIFAAVLKLGDVLQKLVETYDVSDTLRDQEARLQLAERARERLYQLLERTADVKERLAILREIKRLTEEIERVRLSLELLKSQIAFSRITVQLVPRQPEGAARRAGIPFPWIAALQPLFPSLQRLRGKLSITLSDDFAVFEKEKSYRAESPEGTRVRLASTLNRPKADEAFWQKALAYHLGPQYRKAEPIEVGAFKAVLFTSKDSKPYSYLVGVSLKGKQLYVCEVFFPDPEAVQKRLEGIYSALRGITIR